MSRWRKTEHFGWPGNHNQCQEIMRVGCLPLLGFIFLAFHIAPSLTVFEEWYRSPAGSKLRRKTRSLGKPMVPAEICESRMAWVCAGQLVGRWAWVTLGDEMARTYEVEIFWEARFSWICVHWWETLWTLSKKKKDRNSASCNVMCFGRGALNKLDMVDNFISFTPPTIIFSQLAKICFVNQRNPSNSSCSEQDRCKKDGLSGRKRAALCEKGEQGSAFLYVLPILCSLVTSWDHDWGLQPSIAECLLAASRWFLPQKSSPVASMCMLKEGDARLHGAGWGKHMQWHLVFPCEEQTSCFTYLPSAMRGQEASSLENREQACG